LAKIGHERGQGLLTTNAEIPPFQTNGVKKYVEESD
jgi:hypothetical protein